MKRKECLVLSKLRKKIIGPLSGTVLELGSGTGVNFVYYSLDAQVTAIEPSLFMVNNSMHKIGNKKITLL